MTTNEQAESVSLNEQLRRWVTNGRTVNSDWQMKPLAFRLSRTQRLVDATDNEDARHYLAIAVSNYARGWNENAESALTTAQNFLLAEETA